LQQYSKDKENGCRLYPTVCLLHAQLYYLQYFINMSKLIAITFDVKNQFFSPATQLKNVIIINTLCHLENIILIIKCNIQNSIIIAHKCFYSSFGLICSHTNIMNDYDGFLRDSWKIEESLSLEYGKGQVR